MADHKHETVLGVMAHDLRIEIIKTKDDARREFLRADLEAVEAGIACLRAARLEAEVSSLPR